MKITAYIFMVLLCIVTPAKAMTMADLFAALKELFSLSIYSLDISGYRSLRPITHITSDADAILQGINSSGVIVSQEGDIAQLNDSFTRMIKAIGTGIIILIMGWNVRRKRCREGKGSTEVNEDSIGKVVQQAITLF